MRFACYWGSGKPRVLKLMQAFARSCDGELVHPSEGLKGGDTVSVFYGVTRETIGLYRQVVKEGRPYLYFDNGYLNSRYAGGDYYRITWNAEQCRGTGASNCQRFDQLGLAIEPWREDGDDILVVLQSPWWYDRHGTSIDEYREMVLERLAGTPRTVRFREKPGFSDTKPAPKEEILAGVHAVVTHSSALAIDAILMGIPAFCTARCAASPMSKNDLSSIEHPFQPVGRRIWAGVLADNQWNGDEIADGTAWRMLQEARR